MNKKEFEKVRKDADNGDNDALCVLAHCYQIGDGVKKDSAEAFRLYCKAALEGDHELSQLLLGLMYYTGDGIMQDYDEAAEWFRKAAEKGVDAAQHMLGECYYYGYGLEINNKEAIKWYEKAAKQGYKDAQIALQEIKDGTKIKVLNMVLRKEFALEIVRGEKVREYRWFSDFWAKRLCLFEDSKDKYLPTGVKWYDRVHFYPYNNKWFVDCSIEKIEWVTVDKAFQEKYKDEVITNIGDMLFVIHLGKVLATNLQ